MPCAGPCALLAMDDGNHSGPIGVAYTMAGWAIETDHITRTLSRTLYHQEDKSSAIVNPLFTEPIYKC